MAILQLKPGREKALFRRHPWVFSGAVSRLIEDETSIDPGATVRIEAAQGKFLAWGAYSPRSQIQARIWSWDPDQTIDETFFRARFEEAFDLRKNLIPPESTNAYRLIHAESDGFPGLIADRYADCVVLQFLSCGAEYWRDMLIRLVIEFADCDTVFERSDVDVRTLEALPFRKGLLRGKFSHDVVQIHENGIDFCVDIINGHKTGFYLDQRDNRRFVRHLSLDRTVLDCFSYTGGFTLAALKGGARSVTSLDTSREALDLARNNLRLNGYPPEQVEWIEADVFQTLRKFRDRNRRFDLIILDPPKFAPTAAQAQKAARGYKDINLLAFKLLSPGGILVTFSCSGGVSEELFQKIIAGAALDAGVNARILNRLHQAPDHPVALNFPEGSYLKGFVIQVT